MKTIILPHRKVLNAMYESYMSIRKAKWKVDETKPLKLLTSDTPTLKLKTCLELLERIRDAKNFNNWIEIIYICAKLEQYEDAHKTGNYLFGFAQYFLDFPLLLLTLRATLSYIILKLSQNPEYEEIKAELDRQKKELTAIDKTDLRLIEIQQKINALNYFTSVDDHESFFRNIIAKRDNLPDETSFADFEKNVMNGKRKLILCHKLLECAQPPHQVNPVLETELDVIINDPKCVNMKLSKEENKPKTAGDPPLHVFSIFNNPAFQNTKRLHAYNLRKRHYIRPT